MDLEEVPIEKKGINIYLYYWTVPIFFMFILINYLSDYYRIAILDINLMISVVSFLFGFLITISFSMILSRISALKAALAVETGRLISIFHLSKRLGSKFNEKIKKHIDKYTVNTLREYRNYSVGRESVYGMYEDLDYMEVKTENQKASSGSLLYILGEFEINRENLEYLTGRGLLFSLKLANYVMAILLVVLLFLNRSSTFTNWLFIILSSIIFFILLVIEDYEDLRIGDYVVNISNSEQIFDLIGEKRYYPQYILKRVDLERGKVYRVGVIDKETGREKVINMKYKPMGRH